MDVARGDLSEDKIYYLTLGGEVAVWVMRGPVTTLTRDLKDTRSHPCVSLGRGPGWNQHLSNGWLSEFTL